MRNFYSILECAITEYSYIYKRYVLKVCTATGIISTKLYNLSGVLGIEQREEWNNETDSTPTPRLEYL